MSRLHKSRKDRVLLGVCGGLASNLGIDSSLLRLGFVAGAILSGSILFWIYLILAVVLPTEE